MWGKINQKSGNNMQTNPWNARQHELRQQQHTVQEPAAAQSVHANPVTVASEESFHKDGRKIHPALKGVGYVAAIIGLFGLSVLAGVLSDHKPVNLALFHKTSQGEVKGDSTTNGSSLHVGQSSDVNQAPGVQEKTGVMTADNPYFQWVDAIKGIDITVTRQPLPDDFSGNPNALQKMATNIGANQTLSGTKHGTAYMLSASNAQVVTFVYNDKLIFLRSLQQISTDDWKAYIDNFRPQ
jgi:hypothetical protein